MQERSDEQSDSGGTREPVRIPGAARLEEGFGQKVLLTDPDDGSPLEILLCRREGELHAIETLCPHEGGRLSQGPLAEGRFATCPLHLYKFDPVTGAAVDVECDPVRVFEVTERDGDAWVRL